MPSRTAFVLSVVGAFVLGCAVAAVPLGARVNQVTEVAHDLLENSDILAIAIQDASDALEACRTTIDLYSEAALAGEKAYGIQADAVEDFFTSYSYLAGDARELFTAMDNATQVYDEGTVKFERALSYHDDCLAVQ